MTIMGELDAAGHLLRVAVDRYMSACAAFQAFHTQTTMTKNESQGFLDCVNRELLLLDSCKRTVKQAKATMRVSRNNCAAIVPINILPNEILGRIFHIILSEQPCTTIHNTSGYPEHSFLKYTELPSHVCSRWRQIAINMGFLWSHIDLVLGCSYSQKALKRAIIYASRAGDTPLGVHISGNIFNPARPDKTSIVPFLTSIAPRIGSLKLATNINNPSKEPFRTILRACFANCVPGVLTQISTKADTCPSFRFIEAAENPQIPGSVPIEITDQHFEDILSHVAVLKLHELYLPWTSKAYCGLTELHLVTRALSHIITIPESHLVNILRSSPELSVFHFDLQITPRLANGSEITPIHLNRLKVLVLSSDYNQLGTILRWIVPGSNQLQVSLGGLCRAAGPETFDTIKQFFARSNIVKLHVGAPRIDPRVILVPSLLPCLRVLALAGDMPVQGDEPACKTIRHTLESEPRCSRLDALHLLSCTVDMEELQKTVEMLSVQTLTFQSGSSVVFRDSASRYKHSGSGALHEGRIREKLTAICPVVRFVDHMSNPLEDLDYLGLN